MTKKTTLYRELKITPCVLLTGVHQAYSEIKAYLITCLHNTKVTKNGNFSNQKVVVYYCYNLDVIHVGQCLCLPRLHLRWALVFLLATTRTLAKEKYYLHLWKVSLLLSYIFFLLECNRSAYVQLHVACTSYSEIDTAYASEVALIIPKTTLIFSYYLIVLSLEVHYYLRSITLTRKYECSIRNDECYFTVAGSA